MAVPISCSPLSPPFILAAALLGLHGPLGLDKETEARRVEGTSGSHRLPAGESGFEPRVWDF